LGITKITEIKAFAIGLNSRGKILKFEMEDVLIINYIKAFIEEEINKNLKFQNILNF